ncbi:MAG: CPBP family intramembrane metalloprotease [Cyclobacteriaceae bacterium]|nr:CPBP family intramembrane metalloprotease [Cyclobacteriaceae bacterium]
MWLGPWRSGCWRRLPLAACEKRNRGRYHPFRCTRIFYVDSPLFDGGRGRRIYFTWVHLEEPDAVVQPLSGPALVGVVIFASSQLQPPLERTGFASIFFAGILLGATYIFTKNLWFAIVLHLSWNLAQSLLGFNVSGQDFYSLVEYHIPQENIWNGGDFGFEGSLLSIFAEFTLIGVIYVVCAKKACFAIGKKRNARLILPIGK